MTTTVPILPQGLRITDPRTGQLTPEFLKFLADVLRRENDHENRLVALEARIAALETP